MFKKGSRKDNLLQQKVSLLHHKDHKKEAESKSSKKILFSNSKMLIIFIKVNFKLHIYLNKKLSLKKKIKFSKPTNKKK